MKKIAIFGGTFDPTHKGHAAIVQTIISQGFTDKLVVLPSFTPPHKQNRVITDFTHRYKMLEIAFKDFENVEISDLEYQLSLEKSYTFKVMEQVEKFYGAAKYQLIIGGDSLKNLHTWYRAVDLVKKYEIITYPRAGETLDIENLNGLLSPSEIEKLQKNILKAPFFEISSTILKKKLANHENVDIFIDSKVLEYIRLNNLYKN